MRFAMIDAEKASFPVRMMCEQLGVSRSGFYAWCRRGFSNRALEDQRLALEVAEAHQRSHRRYGSPRVHRELARNGHRVGRKRIERLMRERGLRARPTRQFRRTTLSDHGLPVAQNVLARRFQAAAPNTAWVSDITYIQTGEGWLYLVAILDLFSRRVVGWDTSAAMDVGFCLAALQQALLSRKPAPGLLFHADQGSQFASIAFRELLAAHEAVLSMSRRANCWDNAVAESFWSTLKAELTEVTVFATRGEAHQAISEYINGFYNPVRLHSRLGYVSPIEFELLASRRRLAA